MGVLFLLGLPAWSEGQPVPPAAPAVAATVPAAPPAGPQIRFATPSYDFGKAPAGQLVKYDYFFTNSGSGTLEITDVRPSCGCTTAGNWSRKVEAGQAGSIPIQFNGANYNGPVHKTITVTCNSTSQPMTVLELKGTIWRPIDVNPQYVYFNLTPDAQTNEVHVVRIINNQETDITLSEPEVNNRSFQLELKTIRPGKEFELQVKVVPPMAPGTVSASATVKTSVTNMPSIAVSVVAMVQPPLMAMPAQLTLPAGPLVSGTRMGVTFRNNGAGTVTISEPTVNVAGVEARLQEIQPGRVFNVVLNFPIGFDVPAGQQAELVVKTTNPQYPTMKVPIAMMPRTSPVPAMPAPAAPPPNRIQPAPVVRAVPAASPSLTPRPATSRLAPPAPPPLPPSPTDPALK